MKIITFEGTTKNAKTYPYWEELYKLLDGHEIIKIQDKTPFAKIRDMIDNCDVWISIDSFVPHLAYYYHLRSGIVLWGKSDPVHFGYPENRNLFKDSKYFKPQQFQWWRTEPQDEEVWIKPEKIKVVVDSFK